jgi:hypothetical protein
MVEAALKSPSIPLFQRGDISLYDSDRSLEKRGRGDFWAERGENCGDYFPFMLSASKHSEPFSATY